MMAHLLSRSGLRRFAGPFDWLFSTPQMIAHCLDDDFKKFLDRSQYEFVPPADRPDGKHGVCHHRFYRDEFNVRFVFNHHNVLDEETFAHFVRSVGRFRSALGTGNVLLPHIDIYKRTSPDVFCRLVEAVERCSSGRAILVSFYIEEPDATLLMPSLTMTHRIGGWHQRFVLTPTSAYEPLRFIEPVNELAIMRVLHSFNLPTERSESRQFDQEFS